VNTIPRILCFDQIVNEHTKILILGSLPSPISLQRNQYYGNPNNKFWPIIYDLFGHSTPEEDYQARCRFLLEHQLGLWDVFGSANREGAADSNIQNAIVNDFPTLFKQYPQIQRIIFNGLTAEENFKSAYPDVCNQIDCIRVMSTSPALARRYEEKLQNWREGLTR